MSEEAYDLRDSWTPTTPNLTLGLGQQPGQPDPRPGPATGEQADDHR